MPGRELVPRPVPQLPVAMLPPPWPAEPRKRHGEGAFAWLRSRRHWTVPAAVPLVALAAGTGVHAAPATARVAVLGAAWALAVAVAFFAPHKWTDAKGEPRMAEVAYAVGSAAAVAGWLTTAAVTRPRPWLLIPLAVLGTAWGVPWWLHKRPRGARKRAALVAKWDTWWQSLCTGWGLAGSGVIGAWPMGVTMKIRIQGVPGRHSIQNVRQVMHLIESGLDGYADIGMVRAEPVKGKPSQFDLFLKQENPLKQPVEFDQSLQPQSVHDLYPLGMAETGAWRMSGLRRNGFTIGAKRTGKSNHLLVKLAALTGCRDDRQILVDLKGGRSARPVLAAGAVDYVITETDEARMVLRMLVAEAKARGKLAYADEEEQLHATEADPAIHLEVDETHGLTSVTNGDAECARLLGLVASLGAGLEIYVDVYTQHGSLEESVRTEQTRGNLDLRAVYRVEEARHGAYVIPEYNRLDASKLEEKGTCYVKDGHEAVPEQIRAPHMPHRLLRQVATHNAALVAGRPPLRLYCGPETAFTAGERAVTWQEWWDTRWLRLDPAFRPISPQYAAAIADRSPAAPPVPAAAPPMPAAVPGTGDGRAAAARIEAELAGVRIPPGPAPWIDLRPVLAAQEDAFAAALEGAPAGGITPKQLKAESGRGNTWVHMMLAALTSMDAVTQHGRGRYAAVPGVNVREAMRQVAERNDQLYREARALVSAA